MNSLGDAKIVVVSDNPLPANIPHLRYVDIRKRWNKRGSPCPLCVRKGDLVAWICSSIEHAIS